MNSNLTFKEVNFQIDLRSYLASLGFHPTSQRGADVWYKSPFHDEKTPSFKINEKHQIWYDHSLGIGGDLIDFGKKYHNCGYTEVLDLFKNYLSFQPVHNNMAAKMASSFESEDHLTGQRGIKIVQVKPIFRFYLISYLKDRCIPLDLANQFLKEVDYTNSNGTSAPSKLYTALGFKNDLGGYELRSKYFKGSSAPKSTTFISNLSPAEAQKKPLNEQSIAVIEGCFSFLSFQNLWFHNQLQVPQPDNFFVLNSLSFFRKNFEFMETFRTKMLFLDNDKSGQAATEEAMGRDKNYVDYRDSFGQEKDLNAFLIRNRQSKTEYINERRRGL